MRSIILKILAISFFSYGTKTITEIIIEWLNIIPLKVKAHIWGEFSRSKNFIWIDFLFHFWAYIVITVLFYLIFKFIEIKKWLIFIITFFIIIGALLIEHNFQFPINNHYPKALGSFNFKFIEQLIVYSLSVLVMFVLIDHHLINSNLKNNARNSYLRNK